LFDAFQVSAEEGEGLPLAGPAGLLHGDSQSGELSVDVLQGKERSACGEDGRFQDGMLGAIETEEVAQPADVQYFDLESRSLRSPTAWSRCPRGSPPALLMEKSEGRKSEIRRKDRVSSFGFRILDFGFPALAGAAETPQHRDSDHQQQDRSQEPGEEPRARDKLVLRPLVPGHLLDTPPEENA